jgi:hypothetical protein
MPYLLNGSTASISPQGQKWQDVLTGYDHVGRPIFAASKSVELTFDQMSVSLYQQWSALNGTSMVSVTLLAIDSPASFVTYNNTGIHFQIKDRPTLQAGVVSGWTALVMGITP